MGSGSVAVPRTLAEACGTIGQRRCAHAVPKRPPYSMQYNMASCSAPKRCKAKDRNINPRLRVSSLACGMLTPSFARSDAIQTLHGTRHAQRQPGNPGDPFRAHGRCCSLFYVAPRNGVPPPSGDNEPRRAKHSNGATRLVCWRRTCTCRIVARAKGHRQAYERVGPRAGRPIAIACRSCLWWWCGPGPRLKAHSSCCCAWGGGPIPRGPLLQVGYKR